MSPSSPPHHSDLSSGAQRRHGLDGRLVLTIAVLMGVAWLLRWINLSDNPTWDGDEGYNLNIAANLGQGHAQMFALSFAFVQHPPLFFLLAAAAFRVVGVSMVALRAVAVTASVLVVPALVVAGLAIAPTRRGWGAGAAVGGLGALIFSTSYAVVVQTRFAYTYNLLLLWTALFLAAGVWCLRTDNGHRRALLVLVCGALAGGAVVTDQEGVSLLIPLLLLLPVVPRWRVRMGALGLWAISPATFVITMLALKPAAFLFDVVHTAQRVAGGSLGVQMYVWVVNLFDFLRFSPLIPLGLCGVLLIPRWRQRAWVMATTFSLLAIVLKVRDPNPLFRAAEPLWAPIALGLGVATWWGYGRLVATIAPLRKRAARILAAGILMVPLVIQAVMTIHAVQTTVRTPIDAALPRSAVQARAVAAWVNRRVQPTDLVLAMPQISWLFHARQSEILQAQAIEGQAVAFYPAGLARSRFVYDVHVRSARYLIVDDFTRQWIAALPQQKTLVVQIEQHWCVAYRLGEYVVYSHAPPAGCPH